MKMSKKAAVMPTLILCAPVIIVGCIKDTREQVRRTAKDTHAVELAAKIDVRHQEGTFSASPKPKGTRPVETVADFPPMEDLDQVWDQLASNERFALAHESFDLALTHLERDGFSSQIFQNANDLLTAMRSQAQTPEQKFAFSAAEQRLDRYVGRHE